MLIVKTTFAKRKEAENAAGILVRKRLAACASVYICKSFFLWGGRLRKESEFVLELKIKDGNYPEVEKRIKELSSYSLPQIIATGVKKGSREYLEWVRRG